MRAHEHRAIGDAATGHAAVNLGGKSATERFVLSFGDVVALSGDFFRPDGYRLPSWHPASELVGTRRGSAVGVPHRGHHGCDGGIGHRRHVRAGGAVHPQVEALGQGLAGGHGLFCVPLLGGWLTKRCCEAYHTGLVEPLALDPHAALLELTEGGNAPRLLKAGATTGLACPVGRTSARLDRIWR